MPLEGDSLFWRDTGNRAAPAVLCLHGQFFDGRVFEDLSWKLAGARRVLVPDLPGNGLSPLPRPYSLDGVRSALELGLAARRIGELSVVGTSLGCYHALGLALASRVRVRHLVLLGPIAGADPETKAFFAGHARAFAGGMNFVEPFMSLAVPADWATTHPAEMASLKARVAETLRTTLIAELDSIDRMVDLRPRLHEIRVPTLVRVGDADRNTPVAWAEAIARAIPGATLQVVPGVGHLYLAQDREGTADAVDRFLS